MGQQIFTKLSPQMDLIMLNTFTLCQNLAKSNRFGDICKHLMSDPYVLFLATAVMLSNRSKTQTVFLLRILYKTKISTFIEFCVASFEKKIFESNNIKKRPKRAIPPTWVNRFLPKFDHRWISSCRILLPMSELAKPNGLETEAKIWWLTPMFYF